MKEHEGKRDPRAQPQQPGQPGKPGQPVKPGKPGQQPKPEIEKGPKPEIEKKNPPPDKDVQGGEERHPSRLSDRGPGTRPGSTPGTPDPRA